MTTLRIARATNDFDQILRFYRDGLGLDVLGSFAGHAGFDGVMLGARGESWHLEFTRERGRAAPRATSEEDLVVLYLPVQAEWRARVERMMQAGFQPVVSHNPWWDAKGKTFEDFEGYRVVLYNGDWSVM